MRTTLAVSDIGDDVAGASNDLRRWLGRHPDLRSQILREPARVPAPGSMGATGELMTLLLAPGGLTAALAAAVVSVALSDPEVQRVEGSALFRCTR
ncbi:effector-associated constant component EACC1 [Streptomyces sp. NBC_00872]|uniref:effector-associated constant component EACC1 n=1 Tax=Streptomyces sp. NBC_00872 TaxID=2903686 RepID=UPI00386EA973|nr:cytochrome P450 [Streptomyces sp. NBC_00872]